MPEVQLLGASASRVGRVCVRGSALTCSLQDDRLSDRAGCRLRSENMMLRAGYNAGLAGNGLYNIYFWGS